MSNIGEAQITRLTRERLAAIKKFLPVRDSFRDNLQAKQQAKMTFTTDTKQLFEPITTATKEVVTAIKESQPVVEVKPVKTIDIRNQKLRDKFTEEFLTIVDKADPASWVNFTASNFANKYTYLKPESGKNFISSFGKWIDVVYKIKTGLNQIDKKADNRYIDFNLAVNLAKREIDERTDELQLQQQQLQKQTKPARRRGRQKKQQDPQFEEITGEGYRRTVSSSKNTSVSNIHCSRNILDDVSRLEVLIGGKRAGNNSPQIINEATEICQRLFQGKIIGMGLYRNLVNELIDVDYFSD